MKRMLVALQDEVPEEGQIIAETFRAAAHRRRVALWAAQHSVHHDRIGRIRDSH